jgi:hypothetical protein
MTSVQKSKGNEQFQALLDTVERLRSEKFPDLDSRLVRELLRLHSDGGDADSELARAVEQSVEHHLTKAG